MKKIKYKIRKFLNTFGIDVYPVDYRNSVQSYLENLFVQRGVNEIWDVGANVGQYANMLRMIGFNKQIISFEALPTPYEILKRKAEVDKNWTTYGPFAISDTIGMLPFFETEDDVSSSILKPIFSKVTKQHEVPTRKLSEFFPKKNYNVCRLLKLDVQGAERSVLDSCGDGLCMFEYVQLEASIQTSYEKEENYVSLIRYLEKKGFKLIFIFPGVGNKKFDLMQIELFFKKK